MNRHLVVALTLALVACGPRDAKLQHEATMEFGDLAIGASSRLELELTNTGEKPAELVFTTDTPDFRTDELGRTLNAGESSTLVVRFSPTALGPRTGTLSLGASTVALSGRGIGPKLAVPSQVTVGPITILAGRPIEPLTSSITIRNTGTSDSLLRLGTPRVEGSAELCLGTFSGSTCLPWQPPPVVDTRTLLEAPLSVLPSSGGVKAWTVIFPSDDPLQSELTTEVIARVDELEPCQFFAPTTFDLDDAAVLQIHHVGSGPCIVQDVTVSAPALVSLTKPRLPLRLEGNATLDLPLEVLPGSPRVFTSVVLVLAEGTPPLSVLVKHEAPKPNCLVVSPRRIDFGSRSRYCNSNNQTVLVSNTCAHAVTIDSVTIPSPAGAPPQSPDCPGTFPCPEFELTLPIPPGTVIAGGSSGQFTLHYRPINFGTDQGEVLISARDAVDVTVALEGSGESARIGDTFQISPLPIADLLVMVDTSPSFVSKRSAVRANLLPLLNKMGNGCFDARFAFAAADGAPDAGVRLQTNDAGESWSSSSDPFFIARALSAFDALPVGSEQEACIGPAADLIDDAGVRDGGFFSVLCVTDALEGTTNPTAALARLQSHVQRPGLMTWGAIANYGATACNAEAADDGVHASLVTATYGVREEICTPQWGQSLLGINDPCAPRGRLYLSTRPTGPLEVRLDGVLSPQANWTYDASNNSVNLLPAIVPPPGVTITVTYEQAVCAP